MPPSPDCNALALAPVPLGCGSFLRSGLKYCVTLPEVGAMKSASAIDAVPDVLRESQKIVGLLADTIDVDVALPATVKRLNFMALRSLR